jgi:alpha-beta hydrolase superfamily lysophospholipase
MANSPSRRSFLYRLGLYGAAAPAMSALQTLGLPTNAHAQEPAHPSPAATTKPKNIWSHDYSAQKGDIKLYLFRKRLGAPQAGQPALPVLFLVHGSSISSRPSFDLAVPGRGEYSLMDVFAGYGFDVWTMDFEGYGRSSKAAGNSNIADGVEDLKAAVEVVVRETGQQRFHFFGESSGGLRAGAFAMAMPERVNRLVLAAFTYTGAGSPTLADRANRWSSIAPTTRAPATAK